MLCKCLINCKTGAECQVDRIRHHYARNYVVLLFLQSVLIITRFGVDLDYTHDVQAPELFVAQMTEYFDNLSWARITADTSAVIGDMMELVRQHQVHFSQLFVIQPL